MIAVDTNILVYAHRSDSAFHAAAKARVRDLAEGHDTWAIPWPCLHEFLAIVTHPRVFKDPTPLSVALAQVGAWRASPGVRLLAEADGYWEHLTTVLAAGRVEGPKVHDARIAAIGIQHGVTELWSADRDFSRFPQLRVRNPLLGI